MNNVIVYFHKKCVLCEYLVSHVMRVFLFLNIDRTIVFH